MLPCFKSCRNILTFWGCCLFRSSCVHSFFSPQHPYQHEYKDVDNDDEITPSSGIQNDDVYLIIGQSNAAGRDMNIDLDGLDAPTPYVQILTQDNQIVPAVQPLNQHSTIGKKDKDIQGLCFGLEFGKQMYQCTGNRTILVVHARGGTRIGHWRRGHESGYFDTAIERVRMAMHVTSSTDDNGGAGGATAAATTTTTTPTTRTFKGILWHQGEGNIKSDGSFLPSYFTKQLPSLIAEFRHELDGVVNHSNKKKNSTTVPFLVGQVLDNDQNKAFNKTLQMVATPEFPVSTVDWVSSLHLTSFDSTHFDATSTRQLGDRYAKAMKRNLFLPSVVADNV